MREYYGTPLIDLWPNLRDGFAQAPAYLNFAAAVVAAQETRKTDQWALERAETIKGYLS